jgi:hypothetical protein
MAVSRINMNSALRKSPLCTLAERMIVAAYTDPSLHEELSTLMGMQVNFRSLLEKTVLEWQRALPGRDVGMNHRDFVGMQIKDLEGSRVQFAARCSMT